MENTIKELNEVFSGALKGYYFFYGLDAIDVEIVLAKKLSDICIQKRPEIFERVNNIHLEEIDANRGLTIFPKTIDGKFTIAINQDYFFEAVKNQDLQWMGTLAHEMTHVYDYMNYVEMNNLDSYDVVRNDLSHKPFALWTEFHARSKGYLFLRRNIFSDKYDDQNDENQTNYILQTELPFQIEWLSKKYEDANGDADKQLYEAMQFMGRYSIWEKLFPKVFNLSVRKHIFSNNPWMLDMYEFLINHKDLESANKEFDEMMEIIKSNFDGF